MGVFRLLQGPTRADIIKFAKGALPGNSRTASSYSTKMKSRDRSPGCRPTREKSGAEAFGGLSRLCRGPPPLVAHSLVAQEGPTGAGGCGVSLFEARIRTKRRLPRPKNKLRCASTAAQRHTDILSLSLSLSLSLALCLCCSSPSWLYSGGELRPPRVRVPRR